MALCDRNANCLFIKETNDYTCQCKAGYTGDGSHGNCTDNCLDYCRNEGICLKVRQMFQYFYKNDLKNYISISNT